MRIYATEATDIIVGDRIRFDSETVPFFTVTKIVPNPKHSARMIYVVNDGGMLGSFQVSNNEPVEIIDPAE